MGCEPGEKGKFEGGKVGGQNEGVREWEGREKDGENPALSRCLCYPSPCQVM